MGECRTHFGAHAELHFGDLSAAVKGHTLESKMLLQGSPQHTAVRRCCLRHVLQCRLGSTASATCAVPPAHVSADKHKLPSG